MMKKLAFRISRVKERGSYDSQVHYVWSLVIVTVSLTNVWTFPDSVLRNGGAAFIFAYMLTHLTLGIPLLTLQLGLGQFSSCGAVLCWHFSRLFQGVGFSVMLILLMYFIFFIVVMSWCLNYLARSFLDLQVWHQCEQEIASPRCIQHVPLLNKNQCLDLSLNASDNGVCFNNSVLYTKVGHIAGLWDHKKAVMSSFRRHLPAEDYMKEIIGNRDHEGLGKVQLDLLISVAGCLIIVGFISNLGLRHLNRVMQILMGFIIFLIIVLLSIGCTLDGSADGINFLFHKSDWTLLKGTDIWLHVTMQVVNDLALSYGMMESLASYSAFKGDLCLHAVITSFANLICSIVFSLMIFAFFGFLAKKWSMEMDEIVTGGTTMAFASLPTAISLLPTGARFALLFYFLMIFCVGMTSEVYMATVVVCNVLDLFVELRPFKRLVRIGLCVSVFILCIPLVTEGGHEIVEVMTIHASTFNVFLLTLLQVTAVTWVYGYGQFTRDIQFMVGKFVFLGMVPWDCYKNYLVFCWIYVCHVALLMQVVWQGSKLYTDCKPGMWDDYYDKPTVVWGFSFTLLTLLPVPINVVYRLMKKRAVVLQLTFWQRLKTLALPSERWGPALPKTRQRWLGNFAGRLMKVRSSEILDKELEEDNMDRSSMNLSLLTSMTSENQPRVAQSVVPVTSCDVTIEIEEAHTDLDPAAGSSVSSTKVSQSQPGAAINALVKSSSQTQQSPVDTPASGMKLTTDVASHDLQLSSSTGTISTKSLSSKKSATRHKKAK